MRAIRGRTALFLAALSRKGGQCHEVRLAVARDGDKQHILAAGRFDLVAVDDAATVGQQDDFDEHCWAKADAPSTSFL